MNKTKLVIATLLTAFLSCKKTDQNAPETLIEEARNYFETTAKTTSSGSSPAAGGLKIPLLRKQQTYYTLHKYPSTGKGVAVVYGKIRTENTDNPAAVLFANKKMYLTDSTGGTYKITLTPGKYQLSASTLSYNVMRLESLTLKAGDSVRVDFFLTADNSPHG